MMLTDDGFSSMGGGFLFFDLDSCWRVKSDWRLWAVGEGVVDVQAGEAPGAVNSKRVLDHGGSRGYEA